MTARGEQSNTKEQYVANLSRVGGRKLLACLEAIVLSISCLSCSICYSYSICIILALFHIVLLLVILRYCVELSLNNNIHCK